MKVGLWAFKFVDGKNQWVGGEGPRPPFAVCFAHDRTGGGKTRRYWSTSQWFGDYAGSHRWVSREDAQAFINHEFPKHEWETHSEWLGEMGYPFVTTEDLP